MIKPRLAEFMWQSPGGKIHTMQTNDPQRVYDELSRWNVVFVCFPGDMPIPRKRKEN